MQRTRWNRLGIVGLALVESAGPATAAVAAAVAALAATSTAAPTPDARADSIAAYVTQKMRAYHVPGVGYAVVANGRVVVAGSQGFANLETHTPVTAESVFDLASLTKPFTAVAILLLVEDGKIQLGGPITQWLPEAPAAWRAITVRHLLTHTGGFPEEFDGECEGAPLLDVGATQAFQRIVRMPLAFAPGERTQYSDPGYMLLGMIIENASGLSYRDFVQRRIFDRLGMSRSSVVDQRRILENRVAPYAIRGGELIRGRRDWQVDAPAAFGIWSTVGDVAKFDAALLDATLLSDSSRAQMWTPAVRRDGEAVLVQNRPYGLGWSLGEIRGRPAMMHGGFSGTMLLRLPMHRLSVIVLTNLDAASGRHFDLLARGIAGLYAPEYTSIDRLPVSTDPSRATTGKVETLLRDLGAGRASTVMTAAHRRMYEAMPAPRRAELARSFAALESIAFLACDDVGDRGLRLADPIARICYYRCDLGERTIDATAWFTADGSISSLRLDPH